MELKMKWSKKRTKSMLFGAQQTCYSDGDLNNGPFNDQTHVLNQNTALVCEDVGHNGCPTINQR